MSAHLQSNSTLAPHAAPDPSWLHDAICDAARNLASKWFFEWAIVLRFAELDGRAHCAFGVGTGVISARLAAEAVDGRDLAGDEPIAGLPGGTLPSSLPERVRAAIANRPGQFSSVVLPEDACGPLPRGPQTWALLIVDDTILGVIGLGRVRGPQRIPAAMRRALDRDLPAFAERVRVLVDTPTAERAPLQLVMTLNGRVELASHGDGMWAVPRHRRSAVIRAAHIMTVGELTALTTFIDDWEARITRMHGEAGDRVHVSLGRGRPWRRPRVNALSPRQAEVAERAARGATAGEIAASLGLTQNTAKQHLKDAYRALGVTSRIGLARALARTRAQGLKPLAPV